METDKSKYSRNIVKVNARGKHEAINALEMAMYAVRKSKNEETITVDINVTDEEHI